MNGYLLFILGAIGAGFILDTVVALLNIRSLDPRLPPEFKDVFDSEQYAASQEYTKAATRLGLARESVMTLLTLLFIVLGGFNLVDMTARAFSMGTIGTGLLFTTMLLLLTGMAQLPFSVYATFVVDERFGLNKTTKATFLLDILKTILLTGVLGGPLLAFILWFFAHTGSIAWLYCWAAFTGFTFLLQFLAPVLIMPLFNRFTPLAEGELKEMITDYAQRQAFAIQGIYTMDGSRRSARANAFFTGFGRFRRIVFFDTLLDLLTSREILAVLAHEMGHYKLRHLFRMIAISTAQAGFMLFVLSRFINNPGLFEAFSMQHLSIHASLVFFGFLYSPLSRMISIFGNSLSRRHEYEADEYVVSSSELGPYLINGLKKLSRTNLANLTPHPMYVFFHYSHPPVLARIQAIRKLTSRTPAENSKVECLATCSQCGRAFPPAASNTSTGDKMLCDECRLELERCGCADE